MLKIKTHYGLRVEILFYKPPRFCDREADVSWKNIYVIIDCMGEAGFELAPLGLPIPDYLAPPNAIINHAPTGTGVVFKKGFDVNGLQTQEFLDNYTPRVLRFVSNQYPQFAKEDSSKMSNLAKEYAVKLTVEWIMIDAFFTQQKGLMKNGHWKDAQAMNIPGESFSIPDEYQRLSLKDFLVKNLTRDLAHRHPAWRRLSSTEKSMALEVKEPVEPDRIVIDIRDPKTFAMMRQNGQLEEAIDTKLLKMQEKDLMSLYFSAEDTKMGKVIELYPVEGLFDKIKAE